MSTATITTVGATVNAAARSVTYVANELIRLGLEITASRGVADGPLVRSFDAVEKGLRVWLTTRQLESILIEFLDDSGNCVEAFGLPIDYDSSRARGEHFETKMDSLKSELAKRRPPASTKYRFIASCSDDHFPVPGWNSCELSDVSKLKKRSLLEGLISTGDVKVNVFVYEGESHDEA